MDAFLPGNRLGFFDDPTTDYAILPTYKLGALAAHGLKVILSGEGGDELFAGYGRYRRSLRPWWLGGRPMRSPGLFDGEGLLRAEDGAWRRSEGPVDTGAAWSKLNSASCGLPELAPQRPSY